MPRRELGIKAGEIWAYLRTPAFPLIPVRVIAPGTHYDAYIIIEERYGARWRKSVRRVHLPCKWSQVDEYVQLHAEKQLEIQPDATEEPMFSEPAIVPNEPLNGNQVLVLARLTGIDFDRPIAYNVAAAAAAVGYSVATMRKEIRNYRLRVHYANSKAIILHDDLWNWVESLPETKPEWAPEPVPMPQVPEARRRAR